MGGKSCWHELCAKTASNVQDASSPSLAHLAFCEQNLVQTLASASLNDLSQRVLQAAADAKRLGHPSADTDSDTFSTHHVAGLGCPKCLSDACSSTAFFTVPKRLTYRSRFGLRKAPESIVAIMLLFLGDSGRSKTKLLVLATQSQAYTSDSLYLRIVVSQESSDSVNHKQPSDQ